MTPVALGLLGVAVGSWPGRRPGDLAVRRLSWLGLARGAVPAARPDPSRSASSGPAPTAARRQAAAHAVALLAAAATVLLVGGVTGTFFGLAAAVGVEAVARRGAAGVDTAVRRAREDAVAQVAQLCAVCLRAGMPPGPAIELVAAVTAGPASADLARVAAMSRLGADTVTAWAGLAADPSFGPLARAVARASDSGSAIATGFDQVVADRMSERRTRAEGAAHRAAVIAMVPLGLCFLPAFVCIGVVPVVVGLVGGVLR